MKTKIEFNNVLVLTVEYSTINIVVRNNNEILDLWHIETPLTKINQFKIRQDLLQAIELLITKYNINAILLESCKLLTDTFSLFPDRYVLKNILLNYAIQITLENRYYNIIKYIFEIPINDWISVIFLKNSKYTIDMFKQHILNYNNYSEDQLNLIHLGNYYRTLCFSESISFKNLISEKFWINRESEIHSEKE